MPIYDLGQLNTTALTAPDVYIQKVPPQTRYINGVPTDIEGIVGVGSWGAVNSPVLASADTFGPVTFRNNDLATAIAISAQVGANNIRAVRVTDGTDVAALAHLVDTAGSPVTGATLTAIYTGIVGNIDLVDSTQWPNIAAFADSEGMYIPVPGAVGASYTTVSTNLVTAGTDTPSLKPIVGDWIYWQDNVNGVLRLVSPATFIAAELANLSPEQSTLNKQLPAVVGTQRTSQNQPYSTAEIGAIASARLEVITNPCPGGSYYGCRVGRNASSDPTRNGDNYTRMTNYLALTFAASFGYVIGQLQTVDLRLAVTASMDAFLSNLEEAGMIGDVNGGPAFSVEIDAANNPQSQVDLGYMQAKVQVKYLSIVWFFLVNLEGGQTVSVQLVGAQAA